MILAFDGIALVTKNLFVSHKIFQLRVRAVSSVLLSILLFFGVDSDLSVKLTALSNVVNWPVLTFSRLCLLSIIVCAKTCLSNLT